MVKGVNKSVIEINCTDNGYFERAILFVNPEYSYLSHKRITAEAEKFAISLEEGILLKKQKSATKPPKVGWKKLIISLLLTTAILTISYFIFNKL